MIRSNLLGQVLGARKPRASGDDPAYLARSDVIRE